MGGAAWTLRPATASDHDFLFELNRAATASYVQATWGWDENEQVTYFDAHFEPSKRQVIQVDGTDVGVLAVDETPNEVYLATIALLPDWQGQGVGSSILRSLLERGAQTGRAWPFRFFSAIPAQSSSTSRSGSRGLVRATHMC